MSYRLLVAMAVLFLDLSAAQAAWIQLPQKAITLTIGGQTIVLGTTPQVRLTQDAGGKTILELQATADLADFQAKVPAILSQFAEDKSSCEKRWSFPRLDPVRADGGFLTLSGDIRIVAWLCTSLLKTKLGRETASFTLRVSAKVENNSAKLVPQLTSFDLGQSLLKDAGAEDIVRDLVASAVSSLGSGDQLTFGFPPKVQDLNPVLDSIEIGSRGDPAQGTLTLKAHAPGSLEVLRKIWKLIGGN
ncbi:hypothetical protein BH10PSE7_BH10PSE7_23710 [soil metagenome]